LATALPIAFDPTGAASAAGSLVDANQVDLYAVQLQPGDRVTADVGVAGPGSLAGCLRVFDNTGRQIAFKENTGVSDTVLTFDVLSAGTYFVGVSSNGDYVYDPNVAGSGDGGLTTGGYGLTLTRDTILENEDDSDFTAGQAQNLFGTAGDGSISGDAALAGTYIDGSAEYYQFGVADTGALTASVSPEDGTAFLPRLALYGPSGQLLIQSDAVDTGDFAARLNQYLQPGTYRLAVSAVADSGDPSSDQNYILSTQYTAGTPPSQPLSVGSGPEFLVAGDFNHDGNLDLVTANKSDNDISVLLGNGDHTFRQAVTYNVGNQPVAVAMGDFRHDGNLDLVTANKSDNTVSVLLGNGDGTFQQAVVYPVGSSPLGVAVADFGGELGIVTANEGDNTVSVLLGNGDGTFREPVNYPVGTAPFDVAIGNFNGNADVVTANHGANTVSVLLGNGDGTFQQAVTYDVGSKPYSVSVGSLDGNLDVFTADFGGNSVSVLKGNGDGTFQQAVHYEVGVQPTSVAVARFDGRDGIAVTNQFSNSVSVLLADASGTLRAAGTYRVGYQPEDAVLADFANDGNLDVATVNYVDNTVSILPGNGDGTFQETAAMSVGLRPYAVAVGNFSKDGNPDVVTANSADGTVSVLIGNGDGTFRSAVSYAVGANPVGVAVAPLTLDGNVDIVVANYGSNAVSVLRGRGDGTFLPAVFYPTGPNPQAVALGDFNRDGNLDIVTANVNFNSATGTYGPGSVSILLGNGDGTFRKPVSYAVGLHPQGITLGDTNGDGNVDIVTANEDDNTVSVLLGDGTGGFSKAVAYPVGKFPTSVAVGNFGGHTDIAAANFGDNTVSVLPGNGQGGFGPAIAYSVGTNPTSLAIGDFTRNGRNDIVTANYFDNTVSVLIGKADGTFQPAVDSNVGDSPQAVAVGDFNRDGSVDVITANLGDNSVSVLLGSGAGPFQTPILYPVGNHPVAVDANYDSNDNDVIATANADGTLSVLLGNVDGTSFQSAVTLPVGAVPVAVALGTDGNNNPDAFTANADGTVSAFIGDSSDSLQPAVKYPVAADPVAIAVVYDLNGNPDVVTADGTAGMVSVLLNKGDGTFLAAATYPAGNDPVAVAANSDNNNNDVVVTANADGTVSVLVGNADGTQFQAPVSYSLGAVPVSVALTSDANNNLVIVTANSDGTVSVLRSNSASDPSDAFQLDASYPVGAIPASVTVGSNAQNNLVIVTANPADGTVSVLQGDSNDAFGSAAVYPVGDDPVSVAVANDSNGNGNIDIFTADGSGNAVSELLGNTPFRSYTAQNGVAARNVPFLQDLTGDPGVADSLVLRSNGDLLFRQGEVGASERFQPPTVINSGRPARDAAVFQSATGWAVAAVDEVGNSVTIYTWDPAARSFQSTTGFATGNLPVRIAAADLTGREVGGQLFYGDLVVANNFDNTVTIALQQDDGTFDTLTQPVGSAPSDITFASDDGSNLPNIIVSGQASGDVTVLLNDSIPGSPPTFGEEYRYRAGGGPFEIDNGTGAATVLSQLQSVGIAAGDFTGNGSDDIVVLNRGAESFSLLSALGGGLFASPEPENTYATSARPGAIAAVTLPGDTLPSVAVLMEDLGQIWLYRNQGDGTFAPPVKFNAGIDPSGLSVVTVNEPPAADFQGPATATVPTAALQVGNAFGDILTLLYDGHGGFAPDRSGLQSLPLAVGTVAGTGQQFAVVADQQYDRVNLYYLVDAATGRFENPVPVGAGQALLLAPGAVQTFYVPGDPNPYLAVANSLSNNVLVFHYDSAAGGFAAVHAYPVGEDPVSVAVAQGATALTASGIPDLLVANRGSNDISVLIGSVTDGKWTATPYQRLNSAGEGPIGVGVLNTGSTNGPDLMVTNSDGAVTRFPGIGSEGQGSGFFQDTGQPAVVLPKLNSVAPIVEGNTLIAVGQNGSLLSIDGGVVTTSFLGAAVVTLAGGGGLPLFAGLANDTVVGLELNPDGELVPDSELFATQGEPNALEVAQGSAGTEVFFTVSGGGQPFLHAFGPPVAPAPQPPTPVVESLAGQPLAFVPALLPGVAIEVTVVMDDNLTSIAEAPLLARLAVAVQSSGGGDGGEERDADADPTRDAVLQGRDVNGALEQCLRENPPREYQEISRRLLELLLGGLSDWWRPPPASPDATKPPGDVRNTPANDWSPPHASLHDRIVRQGEWPDLFVVSIDDGPGPVDVKTALFEEPALAGNDSGEDILVSGPVILDGRSPSERVSDFALASFLPCEDHELAGVDSAWSMTDEQHCEAAVRGLLLFGQLGHVATATLSRDDERDKSTV
jgi:hypothetical protein